jgi:hypothetical protein
MWIPRETFDRVVVSVDSVKETERDGHIAIVTLDNPVPNQSGYAKVRISGKTYCLFADIDRYDGPISRAHEENCDRMVG